MNRCPTTATPSVSTSATRTGTASRYYEMPASEWGHEEGQYLIGGTAKGRLPGPWDEEPARVR